MTRTTEATKAARAARLGRPKPLQAEPGSAGLGARLQKARLDKGLSQAELGKRAGVAQKAVCNYETSKTYPDAPTIEKLAGKLGVSAPWLGFGTEEGKIHGPD